MSAYLEGTLQGGPCRRVLCTDEGWYSFQEDWCAAALAQVSDRYTTNAKSARHCTAQEVC